MSHADHALREPDTKLVTALIADQFPQWAALPIRRVEPNGWDNRTFHLGDSMSVRMPSGPGYAAQVTKEHAWLPRLAPPLPLPIPTPIAKGTPGRGYPFDWSVYSWFDGENSSSASIADMPRFATDLAEFLLALQGISADGGPEAGAHSCFRGAPLATYDDETRHAIESLRGAIPTDAATQAWHTALAATWSGDPVWFHGDIAEGNLLTREGKLAAVIDFGCCGVGDPACDLVIAWTLFQGESRREFRRAMNVDEAMWQRGRGWALWKALITLESDPRESQPKTEAARRVIEQILAED